MDALPGPAPETSESREAPFCAGAAWHRSARRMPAMVRWPAITLLVALVLGLGALHGTRTALGARPLPAVPAAPDVASPPARERDWRRGDFYRPAGSTAVRPRLALRPSVWRPAGAGPARLARACAGRAAPHC